jgi:nucleoside-diphosphate-sugar epimerase
VSDIALLGLGYSGRAIAAAAHAAGLTLVATAREPGRVVAPDYVDLRDFQAVDAALGQASALVVTAAPGDAGDPVLARYRPAIAAAVQVGTLRWIGYCSTTGVYGDRGGGAVDEASDVAPGSARTVRRVAAERDWAGFGADCALDIIRLAGIYGPGRSVFDDLREGVARRIDKPGHVFSRIHVDDIAAGVMAAWRTAGRTGVRVLNFADDEPAPSEEVVAYAAGLLGMTPPPLVPFAEAAAKMSPMALSFWRENRLVLSTQTKAALGITWRYPTYRAGLAAILAAEAASCASSQALRGNPPL